MQREIQITADGSHTLFIPEMDEHYHSVNGAIQESLHVFIEAGLHCCCKDVIRVFEVGFGTGLNAFLTLIDCDDTGKVVEYYSVELYPLDEKIVRALNYGEIISPAHKDLFYALHDAEWNKDVAINKNFTLHKIQADNNADNNVNNNNVNTPSAIDLIYFDAFAPDKQPEMWTQQVFDRLYERSAQDAILTTYCAKGSVRRMMQAAGYFVERIPGPAGKREMLRARKR